MGRVIVIAAAKSKPLHLRRWIGLFRAARFFWNAYAPRMIL
jgi:hypothetical protein